ncbi:AAA family ATPase [Suttonella ornithocola]|uniref:Recombination factor protein RarA n=1 Tax=Suttonella ornithocola TaxID=279832 RepID=A0A380MZ88_9GAMM|nr:AAA family ATPase [Suttonella ornithocola]SUO97875.1 recombination factor protein RarA [Suttonella ornithocola]
MIDIELRRRLNTALKQLATIIVGKNEIIALSMSCLIARGHVLLEDLPGAGKTTLAKAFAATLGMNFRRIQFTSDLLPADIVGFSSLNALEQKLVFHPGPIFTQLLLADEINRASPKSQSALLEAMEERQVTIEHHTHTLEEPFFVIATQNPLEQIGTYALPESQLDRFLMRLSMGYPSAKLEIDILRGASREDMLRHSKAQLNQADILTLQTAAKNITVSESLAHYVQKLLAYTRDRTHFSQGLSTRAGLGLVRAAQAYALLHGETAVLPKHIQACFPSVAWHRLPRKGQDDEHHRQAILDVLNTVEVPL